MSEKASGEKLLYCSFCGKSQHEVRKLIAGPSVFICDEVATTHQFIPFQTPKAFRNTDSRGCCWFARSLRWL